MFSPLWKLVDGKKVQGLLENHLRTESFGEYDVTTVRELFGWWFVCLTLPREEGGVQELHQEIMGAKTAEALSGEDAITALELLSSPELPKEVSEAVAGEIEEFERLLGEILQNFQPWVSRSPFYGRMNQALRESVTRFLDERRFSVLGIPHTREEFLPALNTLSQPKPSN